MRVLFLLAVLTTTACATAPSEYEDRIDALTKELRQERRAKQQAQEDYEADVIRAFRREELDRRYPYSGMPTLPDWAERKEKERVFEQELEEATQAARGQ